MDTSSWHCTGNKYQDHPHGKEMQKSKMSDWGGLTNSCEKKRSEKQSGKRKDKHLNAEFQRISRRDKKVFLSDQCKKIEENSRMGQTSVLFKKFRDTKGRFYGKMGSMKDRNGMDLTEAEDIKKRWKDTQKNYRKNILITHITTMVWSLI